MAPKTFLEFAQDLAQSQHYHSIQQIQSLTPHSYSHWLAAAIAQYRNYLTDNWPDMTLREAQALMMAESETAAC